MSKLNSLVEMIDEMKPKRTVFEKILRQISKSICSNFGHYGPIVSKGTPVITGKKNHDSFKLKGTYWIRRCNRFECKEIYSNLEDFISL